ncbi:MAG: site-specific integrase [bacterium]|nr:site-specific integrase [bacterium]
MKNELVRVETAVAEGVTLDMVTEAFRLFLRMDVANGDASPDTVRGYLSAVRSFLAWCNQAETAPATATARDILEYRAQLVAYGYKPGTIAHRLSVVRRFYEALRWHGIRQDNPAEGIQAPRERVMAEDRIRYLETDSLRDLVASIPADTGKGRRDRAMIGLMALHGLRCVEIHRADVADLDLAAAMPTMIARGKNGDRLVYLRRDVAAVLMAVLKDRDGDLVDNAPLFVSVANRARGERITRRGVRMVADSYLAKSGSKHTGARPAPHGRHPGPAWRRTDSPDPGNVRS